MKRGAPRRYDTRTSTCIRLPEDLHGRLAAAAAERDVSMNYLVTKAVEQFIDRLVPVDEMRWTRG
jgi:predicted HicB family RNase H-like nuclease